MGLQCNMLVQWNLDFSIEKFEFNGMLLLAYSKVIFTFCGVYCIVLYGLSRRQVSMPIGINAHTVHTHTHATTNSE